MDNAEAAFVLIIAEANRRVKRKEDDLVGKIVEVSGEVTTLLMNEERKVREEERNAKRNEKYPLPRSTSAL